MFEDFEPEVLNRTPRVHHAVPLGYGTSDPRGTPNKHFPGDK